MTKDQIPGWMDEKKIHHLRPILLELRRLRSRGGIWGLKGGRHGVEELVNLGRLLSKKQDSRSQYDPVLHLFSEHLFKHLSLDDCNACEIYFNLTGLYNKKEAEWRREQAGIKIFKQSYSKFRDEKEGEERHFLTRIAEAIYIARPDVGSMGMIRPVNLSASIIDLLYAQMVSGRNLPYWYGDVDKPELHDVYVPVSLKESSSEQNSSGSLQDAIAKYHHLLIVGGPGAGKSTMAIHFVSQLCQELLVGSGARWIPLYVPARLLLGSGTLQGSLINALSRHLSLGLSPTLEESIFSDESLDGRGWIVFIDGIDEIIDKRYRDRLIDQLGTHLVSRDDRDVEFRLVLLTRKIGDNKLAPLKHTTVGQYEIERFSYGQLGIFVESWFRTADTKGVQQEYISTEQAQTLLNTAVDLGVMEIISVPLLATLTLVAYKKNEHLLPSTTVTGLYEDLVRCLLFDRQERTEAQNQIAENFKKIAPGDTGAALANWLFNERREILANVAYCILSGDDRQFLVIADEWIRGEFDNIPYIHKWEDRLESVLIDTGLLMRQGDDLTFAHREIAAYLAAPIAGLPEHFDDRDNWNFYNYDAGMGQDYSYLLFRIIEWCRRHGSTRLISMIGWDEEASPEDRFTLLKELVAWGLPLDEASTRKYVDTFLVLQRTERQVTLKFDDNLMKVSYVPDADYIRLLSILIAQYPDLAELVLADEHAKYIRPSMTKVGLISLWRQGNKEFVDNYLHRVMSKPGPWWKIAAAEFFIEVQERERASAALRRAEAVDSALTHRSDLREYHTCLDELRERIVALS